MERNSNEIIELKWNLTTKGRRKLSKDWFLYINNKRVTNGKTYWECDQRRIGSGCNVKITLDAADVFVVQTHQQSQAADPEVLIY